MKQKESWILELSEAEIETLKDCGYSKHNISYMRRFGRTEAFLHLLSKAVKYDETNEKEG